MKRLLAIIALGLSLAACGTLEDRADSAADPASLHGAVDGGCAVGLDLGDSGVREADLGDLIAQLR